MDIESPRPWPGDCAEDYLLKIPEWAKEKHSLADVRKFLEAMGNPDAQMRLIHVAGTNGKGSACIYLTAELMRRGYHVGTFVSPHLVSIRERLLYDGQPADPGRFQEAFDRLAPLVAQMMGAGYRHPTFFEYLFFMAMEYYQELPVDFVILETGLGGLLDVTNVVEGPALTVIASIGRDHTQYLGDSLAAIAAHKAGIIKPGCPLVYAGGDPAADAVLRARAAALNSPCYQAAEPDGEALGWFVAAYQARNASLAALALQVLLGLTDAEGRAAMERMGAVPWPGRMEEIAPDVWLDGAHNAHGIRAFAEAAGQIAGRQGKMPRLLFGAAQDKDYPEMIAILCRELPFAAVSLTSFQGGRAARPEVLAAEFRCHLQDVPVALFSDCRAAFADALKQKTKDEVLFVAGSLYLVGEVKAGMAGTRLS